MSASSRRDFFRKAAASSAVTGLISAGARVLGAAPLGMPIGCQTYPVRTQLGQDFPGTIKQLADAGFQTIELCSPVGYASSGFGVLAKYKGAELRKILGDLGVKCESSHFDMKELRENLGGRIEWAKDAGLTQMLVPSLGGPRTPTMDDVKRAADEYNKMGEQSAKAGIQQGLHNEGFELSDGERQADLRPLAGTARSRSWSSFNSRFPRSAAATMQPSTSPSTRDASFRCTCRIGRRKPRRRWQ